MTSAVARSGSLAPVRSAAAMLIAFLEMLDAGYPPEARPQIILAEINQTRVVFR